MKKYQFSFNCDLEVAEKIKEIISKAEDNIRFLSPQNADRVLPVVDELREQIKRIKLLKGVDGL